MQPAYSIEVDIPRALLRLTVTGFFDTATVTRFVAERNAAVDRLKCGRNQHVTLCDVADSKLSTPEVVGEWAKMVGDPRYASRRLAFVLGGSLARMQLRRIAARDHVGFFETLEEAETWLFAPDAEALAAG